MIEESIKKMLRLRAQEPSVLCHCGRGNIPPNDQGTRMCEECFAEGVHAFWDLIDGKIGFRMYYRILRRTKGQ